MQKFETKDLKIKKKQRAETPLEISMIKYIIVLTVYQRETPRGDGLQYLFFYLVGDVENLFCHKTVLTTKLEKCMYLFYNIYYLTKPNIF